jgi:hypothetical protein
MLACRLKNAALHYLVNLNSRSKLRNFNEIITQLVLSKKEQAKKKR